MRGHSAGARRAVRQEMSKPLALELKAWFEQQLARVSGKSLIAEAIRYALHHWDGLTRFLDDGRIELDTKSPDRAQSQKRALCRSRSGGGELGLHCFAHRNLQIARRRPASLPHRRAHQARQSLARRASRRTHALGLGGRAFHQQTRGVTRRIAPRSQQKNQAVKARRSEDRLRSTA